MWQLRHAIASKLTDVLGALFGLHVTAKEKIGATQLDLSKVTARVAWLEDRVGMFHYLAASQR